MAKNYIYCSTNLINNKKYIGSTINEPKRRFNQHIYNATHKNNPKYNYPLYSAIRKYGINNFKFEILEEKECSEQEIREIEQRYIIKMNSLSPNGYNQTINTEHPINDANTYQKIRETKRNKAKCVAEIDKNFNIINIYRSIVDCAEQTGCDERKIAACCRGDQKTTSNRYFCWLNDNNELAIPNYTGYQYKGDKNTTQIQSKSKKVVKIDPNTNEIIDIYDTAALASRMNNCDSSAIIKVCKGRRNFCGGFKWRYFEEEQRGE